MFCSKCEKKLNLIEAATKCKCGKLFCRLHKFQKEHTCSYDYRAEKQDELKRALLVPKNKQLVI